MPHRKPREPKFHFSESLTAELGFTAERLLSYERVRTGGTCVDLIINEMMELEVVHDTYGYGVVEIFAGTSVAESYLTVGIHTCCLEAFGNIRFVSAVEYGSHNSPSELAGCDTEVYFKYLTDVHSRRNAHRIEYDIKRSTVGQVRHFCL